MIVHAQGETASTASTVWIACYPPLVHMHRYRMVLYDHGIQTRDLDD